MPEVRKNEALERYEIVDGDTVLGFAEYRPSGEAILMPHTEINPDYEGQGLASQIAKFALEDIRGAGKHVIPMCPFIAGYIRRHEAEYLELVEPAHRKLFRL